MKIYYIANARMPTEKAHGIQIAEMCEAFIEAGVDVTLIVPRRTADPRSVREYYGLRTDVPVRRLPVLPFYNGERAGFSIASLSFMCSAAVFLLLRRVKSSSDVIYTVDMDTFSFTPLPLFGMPCFIEIHGQKPSTSVTRYFFRHARGVIVTNTEIERAISGTFNLPTQKLLVEPNGADLSAYKNLPSKEEARRQLGLPLHERTALYIGRFYEWKGL
jgi:glycosyltransferase involved in cell wall biosynthesis